MALSTPGYCTFTATTRPSGMTARCTWPIDAAATGTGSHCRNSRADRAGVGHVAFCAHARSGPLLLLGHRLVAQAEPGRGHGFQTLVADGLAAGFAGAVGAVVNPADGPVDQIQLGFDLLEQGEV